MSGRARAADRATWKQLLTLGEQLTAQPTFAAQRDLIVQTAARLLEGRAAVWLAEPLYRLPDTGEVFSFPKEPPSDLMRRARDDQQMALGTGAAAGTEPVAVAMPLLAGGRVLGTLEIVRAGGPPFAATEIELLECLVAQVSVALQATRQVAIERWRVTQLSLVSGVSAQVAAILDLDELFRRVTDLILHTFNYYYVTLFTLEPGQETLRCRACADAVSPRPDQGHAPPTLEVRLGDGIIGHVAQTGEEVLANDVSRDPYYRPVDILPETRSEVALPLKVGDRLLGVLDVQSDQPDDFDETDLLVLRALADQIAIAVEDKRLYNAHRRRAEQLSAVAEVSRAVTSILDLDALLNEVVTLIHKQFGYPYVYLFTADPAREQIVYRAGTLPLSPLRREPEEDGAPGPDTSLPPPRGEPEGGGAPGQEPQAEGLAFSLHDPQGTIPWVARHGEAVLANDVSREPRYHSLDLPPADTRSELAVPLTFGGHVLGVLDVRSDRLNAFGEDDRFLFHALADSVAIAIRNANLYRSERWRRQVADSLREVAGLLSADLALEEVLDAILTELERTLPCDVAGIWLMHDDDLHLSAVRGYVTEVYVPDFSLDVGPWLTQALAADQPLIRTPPAPSEPLGAALEFAPDYSAIAAPLRAGNRRLGLLALAHHAPGRYGAEASTITAAFASYAAVAIENAHLYQAAQEQAWISTVLLQVAEATQSLTTLDEVLEAVVRMAPMLAGVDRCALLLWDEPTGMFEPSAAYGLSPTGQAAFDRWRVAPGEVPAFDRLRLDKAPLVSHDVTTDSRLMGVNFSTFGFRALLLLPLLAHGQVVGAMLFDYQSNLAEFEATGAFHGEQITLIQGIAHQTAAAVESARLLQAQQEEAYVSAALLQVAQAVVSLTNLDDILSTIVRIVPILVGVEWCAVFLWDGEQAAFRPMQTYGVPRRVEATLRTRRYGPGDFPLLDTIRERDQLVAYWPEAAPGEAGQRPGLLPPDLAADVGWCPEEAAQGGRHALLAVPLSVKGDVLGAMVLEEADAPQRSRERRLEIITGIAHQAALAVQNDRLQREMAVRERLERELQLAHEIQQTFMPRQLPDLPGWDLAFAWQAARQVAGDFYDFFELSGGRLGLVIADVADKGMPAALFMALTRTVMRAAALEATSPAAVLAHANDLLVPDAHQGMFVTAIYAVLSLDSGRLTYVNAGHNLPLWLQSATQELGCLEGGGMALGVSEGLQFQERAVFLKPGDCLVLYTDGITEAFSPQEEIYGEERLRMAIQAADDSSAQAILDAIHASVATFAGDLPLSDDQTLMVLRRIK